MAYSEYNLPPIVRGDHWESRTFRRRSGGELTDFTDCSFVCPFVNAMGRVIHVAATTDPGDGTPWSAITVDGTDITFASFSTAGWKSGEVRYSVKCTYPSGFVETIFGGYQKVV